MTDTVMKTPKTEVTTLKTDYTGPGHINFLTDAKRRPQLATRLHGRVEDVFRAPDEHIANSHSFAHSISYGARVGGNYAARGTQLLDFIIGKGKVRGFDAPPVAVEAVDAKGTEAGKPPVVDSADAPTAGTPTPDAKDAKETGAKPAAPRLAADTGFSHSRQVQQGALEPALRALQNGITGAAGVTAATLSLIVGLPGGLIAPMVPRLGETTTETTTKPAAESDARAAGGTTTEVKLTTTKKPGRYTSRGCIAGAAQKADALARIAVGTALHVAVDVLLSVTRLASAGIKGIVGVLGSIAGALCGTVIGLKNLVLRKTLEKAETELKPSVSPDVLRAREATQAATQAAEASAKVAAQNPGDANAQAAAKSDEEARKAAVAAEEEAVRLDVTRVDGVIAAKADELAAAEKASAAKPDDKSLTDNVASRRARLEEWEGVKNELTPVESPAENEGIEENEEGESGPSN